MAKLQIKKGRIITTMDRKDLVDVTQAHDGIVFMLKEGIHIYVTDGHMPIGVKELIKTSAVNFLDRDVEIDLMNYKKPASITIPEPETP